MCLECHSGVGFLDNVKLHSAREGSGGSRAVTVEQCTCPDGFVGQFCESCAPGYRRDPPGTSPFSQCIPCNCNMHSDACDVTTGALIVNPLISTANAILWLNSDNFASGFSIFP